MSHTAPSTDRATAAPTRTLPTRALLAALAVVALVAAGWVGSWTTRTTTPSDTSAEAGFARDMQTHHNQAVQMALIIREKSPEPTLAAVAYDIVTGQQQQSGQMYAWLNIWRLPPTSAQPPMAWMSATSPTDTGAMATGSTMSPGSMLLADGRMPGMATVDNIAQLKKASGRNAETLFLTLMIAHHASGITMARAIQPLTDRPVVLTLARAIATAQAAEIGQLKSLLATRSN